jgi:hypothetical protein
MKLTLRLAVAVLTVPLATAAIAGPKCTEEPQSKWLSEQQMTEKFTALGFRDNVKRLHVSGGKCWEIYGTDKSGRKVEVYFHPITGVIVEQNVKE